MKKFLRSASLAILGICATMAAIGSSMASSAPPPGGNTELIAEVDSCRTWRVKDDLGQGNHYARLEGRTIYFTKCSASTDSSEKAAPVRGEIPANAAAIAEVDGCRVWRITDGEGKIEGAAQLEPRYLYFTKCGNMTVPTIESGMR